MLLEIRAPQTVFVQIASAELQGLETRDRVQSLHSLQCPELGLLFKLIANIRKCLCSVLGAG